MITSTLIINTADPSGLVTICISILVVIRPNNSYRRQFLSHQSRASGRVTTWNGPSGAFVGLVPFTLIRFPPTALQQINRSLLNPPGRLPSDAEVSANPVSFIVLLSCFWYFKAGFHLNDLYIRIGQMNAPPLITYPGPRTTGNY